MFYLFAIIVIAIPAIFGLPLVWASKEEMRAKAERFPRWMMPSPDSQAERVLFFGWRFIGWAALLFAAAALCFVISTIFTHTTR